MIKKRSRPTARIREPSPEENDIEGSGNEATVPIPLEDLVEFRKFRRARQGINTEKLNKGAVKKKKVAADEDETPQYGLTKPGASSTSHEAQGTESDSKMKRVVRTDNFTQQTNALDVDKHMMAYIEENMKARRGGRNSDTEDQKETIADPNDALFKQLPDSLKAVQKAAEEGNVTNSLAMLTAIPEVDLGMDTRLRNIEETEKAKRVVAEERKERKHTYNDEDHLAATRFYKPRIRQKTDADIIRDAKLEAMGLPPESYEPRQRDDRVGSATDELVMERFKKRMRR